MSEGKGRARGRAYGRARGVPVAPQQGVVKPEPQPQQHHEKTSSAKQYQMLAPTQSAAAAAAAAEPAQQRGSARGRGQVVKPSPPQQHISVQPSQPPPEEGAYGVDPGIETVTGAFRGLAMGESKPGQALRRGAVRGRFEVVPPPETKRKDLVSKQGEGGNKVKILSNHFKLIKKTNWSLYQYRVDFSPDEERTKIRKALLRDHKDTLGEAYMFDGSMLFTIHRLQPDKFDLFSKRDSDQAKIRITIKFTNELAFGDYQYIQLFNIILRHCMDAMKFQLVGREYFDPASSAQLKNYNLEIWPGYSTSILQHENDIMLGLDVSHKVLRTDTVLQFLDDCRERYGDKWQNNFEKAILGAVVFTFYNNKPYRVDDVAFDLTPLNTFKKGNSDITYMDYYKEKYQLRIKNIKQPLLVSRPKARDVRGGRNQNIILIPELCHMTGLSDEMRSNFSLMKAVADKTRVPPGERISSYYDFMRRMNESKEVLKKLDMWNIRFSQKLEMIEGRVLDAETLFTAKDNIIKDHGGDWTRNLRGISMFQSVKLEKWVVVVSRNVGPDRHGKGSVDSFLNELHRVASGLKFEMARPFVSYVDNDRTGSYIDAINKAVSAGGVQLVMCIINGNRSDLYGAIKKYSCVDRPVPSQVIATRTLSHKNLPSVATKIVIQINCKLGGSPWFTPIPFKPNAGNKLSATMVIGFDVCHEKSKKSVGAMVASLDYYFSKFYSAVSNHSFGQELSNDIANHVSYAVLKYKEVNDCLPPRLIMYRDGVGESNIKYVLEHEVEMIQGRLHQMFPNNPIKIMFIVVSKRIQTRIFVTDGRSASNPVPGTVVDDVITQPEKYDFFLVSQSVRQGTVSPTNYNVIFDTLFLPPNHVQRITYKMCHLYYNCSSTVRVPAQVQYAHKLAFLVGQVTHHTPSTDLEELLYFL